MIRAVNNLADTQQAIKDIQDSITKQINNALIKQKATIPITLVTNEIGANNAITGAVGNINTGTIVVVLLSHTLQAGANTFNGFAIKSAKNPANNIATAYAFGGVIQLFWTGSIFLDLSQ